MTDNQPQPVYFISESTGITAETFGNSLLTQFPGIEFERHYLPFTNTRQKAEAVVADIERHAREGRKPLVFATMPDTEINAMLAAAPCHYYEIFDRFLNTVARDLGVMPTRGTGRSHGVINDDHYEQRIETVNYALSHDDAISLKDLDEADVILLGVSRAGKTPTSLYLALHYGLRAANYPLTEDDFERDSLPPEVEKNIDKAVAITISPERLHQIREKRRPGSSYASLETCRYELERANRLFRRHGLEPLDSTTSSIEELAARIAKQRNPRSH